MRKRAIEWPGRIRVAIAAGQHRAASALGVKESQRAETVIAMIENNRRRGAGYWIQLVLSVGIATLGLVLNSTAVVIAAMLVSPLMGPILELGMGFAVGSPFLVLRATLRVGLSVVLAVAFAAAMTQALPFQEVTLEISSRTSPTLLDLSVAVFCALTAAYTTIRPTSDATSAAAGTAIGVALVPPLCVWGFGFGIGSARIAGGAALLFSANLSAILVLAVVSFLIVGFDQVNAERVESGFLEPDTTGTGRLAARMEMSLRHVFGSRFGMAMRILVPGLFLASVYFPLRKALNEVTWEVRSRAAIRPILALEAPRAVQARLVVERHTITIHLVVLGTNERAEYLERTLTHRITERTGVIPNISVTAVPDARTLAAISLSSATGFGETPVAERSSTLAQRAAGSLADNWPSAAAGPLLGWNVVIPSSDSATVSVYHLGPPLGTSGGALLAAMLSDRVGASVRVTDKPLDARPVSRRLSAANSWLQRALPLLGWVENADKAFACVSAPVGAARRLSSDQKRSIAAVRASAAARAGRVVISDSSGWSIRVVADSCGTKQ